MVVSKMTRIKIYQYVYGENMSVSEVDDVANEIIRRYERKEIPYSKAMKQLNFMYVLTFSKPWKTAYSGNLTELREMLQRKKEKLKGLAGR